MEDLLHSASPYTRNRQEETAHIRNPLYGWGPLVVSDHPQMHVPFDMLRHWAHERPTAPCFGTRRKRSLAAVGSADSASPRPYTWMTYAEAYRRVLRIAKGMAHVLGVSAGDRVAVYSKTREEFHLLLMTCCVLRCVVVPTYESVGKDAVSYILRHSGARVVFASQEKLAALQDALQTFNTAAGDKLPRVVTLDDRAAAASLAETSLEEVEQAGWLVDLEEGEREPPVSEMARPGDVHLIMYTSGTTGQPRGVMISHQASLGSGMAIAKKIPQRLTTLCDGTDFVLFTFLPLAHVFCLAMDYVALRVGGCIGFYSGDTRTLMEDMAELHPTVMSAVPRIFQRIHDAVITALQRANIIKRWVFNAAYMQKYYWLLSAGKSQDSTDPVLFGAIREKLGGRMQIIVSGGAPMPQHIAEFFKICVCDTFLEGYGMTETCAIGVSTDDGAVPLSGGIVAAGEYAPYQTSEVKLISVPDMNYFVTDDPPRGELCIRSTTNMLGYYNDPQKTAEVIDDQGWVHSGDIAVLQSNGKIRVIDRVKNMFKLSQGEYLSSEYIEQVITFSSCIAQAFVHGDSQQSYPVAVLVPNPAFCQDWATKHGKPEIAGDMEALCKCPELHATIAAEILRVSQEHKLKGYEIIRHFHLHAIPFDDARDMLTPSLKLRRHVIRAFFKNEITAMYSQEAAPSESSSSSTQQ